MPQDTRREETRRVDEWRTKLNAINPGWTKGDLSSRTEPTADLVNDNLKIAFELKLEADSLDNKEKNIEVLSNRLQWYFESASKKFQSYPSYKTILTIELASYIAIAVAAMEGIVSLHLTRTGQVLGTSIRNKNLYCEMENIGMVIFCPGPSSILNRETYYFDNPFSIPQRKMDLRETEVIIGRSLKFMDLNA